jgi:signal transduction histidine kinase
MFNQIFSLANYYFNSYAIPPLIVSLLIFSIGVFALWQNKRSPVNIAFFLQCFSVAIWIFGISFVYLSRLQETALLWYRYVTFLGVSTIMPGFSLLAIAWSGELRHKKMLAVTNYIIPLSFYFLAVTTNVIIDSHNARVCFWGFYPIYKPAAFLFILVYIAQFIAGLRILYFTYRIEKVPIKKIQIKTIVIATMIAVTASLDFLPKFFNIQLYPYGYIPIFIYVCLVAYSIAKHKTFDIETAIHKTLMWLFSSSFIIIPILFLYKWLFPYIINSATLQILFWLISFLFIAIYLRLVQPRVDHFFQRRHADLEEISNQFTEDLVHLKGLAQLIQRIEKTIAETLYPQHIEIFIYNEAKQIYKLANEENAVRTITELGRDNLFLRALARNNKIAYKEFSDIDPAYSAVKDAAKNYFSASEAMVVIPLALNDNLLGVINLGRKSNLRRYSGTEFIFLAALKNQSTIAIANSLLYENIEEQVRQRTKEVVDIQKQLIHAEKLATVGTLAGGVAHEINNPLTAILTNVQMLLTSGTVNDTLDKESLELIEEATKRCRTIVQKLMAYARKPLETTEVSKISLLDVLKNVTAFIGYQLEQDNIKVITKTKEGSEYLVMGNRNELEQVLTNIFLNGRDAIKKIKKSGAIEISFSENGENIKVDIKDGGAGMPKEIVSKIFDPFFTTKDVGKGVGLGLSICQAIIEKHKGTIAFKTELNKGTVFTIRLPKAEGRSRVKTEVVEQT